MSEQLIPMERQVTPAEWLEALQAALTADLSHDLRAAVVRELIAIRKPPVEFRIPEPFRIGED